MILTAFVEYTWTNNNSTWAKVYFMDAKKNRVDETVVYCSFTLWTKTVKELQNCISSKVQTYAATKKNTVSKVLFWEWITNQTTITKKEEIVVDTSKQDTLVSWFNIKTVNGNSLLWSWDVSITSAVAWWNITWTLSAQTDLQNALIALQDDINAKADVGLPTGWTTFQILRKASWTNYHTQWRTLAVTKADVWLWNVDNTSDINKPISTATQNALNILTSSVSTISWNVTALQNDIVTKLWNSFETVSRNLKSYPYTLTYSGGSVSSIAYNTWAWIITKTITYSWGSVSSIVLSGSIPSGILTTKTFWYTSWQLTSVTYS